MKKFLLLALFCANTCVHGDNGEAKSIAATTFAQLEQPLITAHAYLLKRELESTYRTRVITAVAGAALGVASVYALYKSWPSVPPSTPATPEAAQTGTPNRPLNTQDPTRDTLANTIPTQTHSWFVTGALAVGAFAKNSLLSVARILPAGLALLAINTVGATAIAKTVGAAERYYRPLNWTWMLTTKTALDTRCQHLMHYAALLEGTDTPAFDVLKNTHISWQTTIATTNEHEIAEQRQQVPIVTAHAQPNPTMAAQYVPLNTFDELVKLQLLARYGKQLPPSARAAVYAHFVTAWNDVVNALTLCLGYLTYKQANAQQASPTMREQLRSMIDDIVVHTNALAHELPKLIAQKTTTDASSSLLAHVYAYGKTLKDWCLTLEINPILA